MSTLNNTPCKVMADWTDRVWYEGTYLQCKVFMMYSPDTVPCDLGIVSAETGRFMCVVFD